MRPPAPFSDLGFTPRQVRFVTLVALHSGYCLRRQYAAFAGVECGQNVRDFFDRLVALHLARQITFRRDRGHIYHLFARSIYAALEPPDNRNRRQASPALIARKLMLLDFVLTQPDRDWYVSEAEKVHLLTDTLRVPAHALKVPVFVTHDPLRVHLVCLVTDPAARDIALFVRGHHTLLTHLPAHTLVIVRPGHISTEEQCRAAHAFAMKTVLAPARAFDRATLRWYLDARRRIDQGQLRTLSVPDINRYRVCGRQAAAPSMVYTVDGPSSGTPRSRASMSGSRRRPTRTVSSLSPCRIVTNSSARCRGSREPSLQRASRVDQRRIQPGRRGSRYARLSAACGQYAAAPH